MRSEHGELHSTIKDSQWKSMAVNEQTNAGMPTHSMPVYQHTGMPAYRYLSNSHPKPDGTLGSWNTPCFNGYFNGYFK